MAEGKPTIIFVCTGNSCRSHMAEGLMRQIAGNGFDVYSAGSQPAGYVHPLAIVAMREVGINLEEHRSKGLSEFGDKKFDYVVTVCDHAAAACPTLRGTKATLRWPLRDPAGVEGTDEEQMAVARQVRDELNQKLREFLAAAAR